jgi:hypothetical protein
MDAATLLLLTSSVGVGFGWQPMPDGSPRVEYLVQIEPEMLTALEAGSVIPIVSEVPQEIGPIGRVRIVIGRETLPRQGLPEPIQAIRHKPNSDSPGQIISSAPPAPVQEDPIVLRGQFSPEQSIVRGPPQVTKSQAPKSQAPKSQAPGPRMPDSRATVGFPVAAGVQGAKGFQGATGVPGAANTGTSTSFGSGTQGVGAQGVGATSAQPAAPGSLSSNPNPPTGGVREGTTGTRRLDQPIPVGVTLGAVTSGAVTSGAGQPVAGQSTGNSVPQELSSQAVSPGFPQPYPAPPRLSFPASELPVTKSFRGEKNIQGVGKLEMTLVESPQQSSMGPPQTEQVSAGRASLEPAAEPTPKPPAESSTETSAVVIQSPVDSSQLGIINKTEPQLENSSAQPEPSGGGFTLLLAWVLLVGSVAGNLYLFWSYLDIRSKYHAMIRSNRGSHHSYSSAA